MYTKLLQLCAFLSGGGSAAEFLAKCDKDDRSDIYNNLSEIRQALDPFLLRDSIAYQRAQLVDLEEEWGEAVEEETENSVEFGCPTPYHDCTEAMEKAELDELVDQVEEPA